MTLYKRFKCRFESPDHDSQFMYSFFIDIRYCGNRHVHVSWKIPLGIENAV